MNNALLYSDLVSWYRLIDPLEDHWEEAMSYQTALENAATPRPETLLELGAGAGHNAAFLKKRFRCTLVDPSPGMQNLSIEINPECEHLAGDMRSVRLGRTFDTVFIHDAICYMTSEADLLAAIETAFIHTRPGGAAVFAPDCMREKFRESVTMLEGDNGTRALAGVAWQWDPDPSDHTYTVDYNFLLRENGEVRTVHDRHIEGLFTTSTWRRLLTSVGYRVDTFERPIDDGSFDEVFVCRRPV